MANVITSVLKNGRKQKRVRESCDDRSRVRVIQCEKDLIHPLVLETEEGATYESAQAAMTEYHRLGDLNNRNLLSYSSGSRKSLLQVPNSRKIEKRSNKDSSRALGTTVPPVRKKCSFLRISGACPVTTGPATVTTVLPGDLGQR